MKKNRIIISGGGTGGHIYPGIAIGNYLKNLNHSFVFKYGERSDNSNYTVLDSSFIYQLGLKMENECLYLL